MNYYQIKVNPYVFWIEETLKKNTEDLINQSSWIFDSALYLESIEKWFLNLLDKSWISFEYKWDPLSFSYFINWDINIDNVITAVQSSYPVTDIKSVNFETDNLIKKWIIYKSWDDYNISKDYFIIHKTYTIKNNDSSIISTFSTNKLDYFHKILSILNNLNDDEYSRYQVTLVPSTDYFKENIKKIDHKLNNLKERKSLNLFDKENKQLGTSLRNMLDVISKEKFNSKWFFINIRFHLIWKKWNEAILEDKLNQISQVLEKLSIYDSYFSVLNEWDSYLFNYYNSYLNHKAISNGSLITKNELLSLFHFPILTNANLKNIDKQNFQKIPIPPEVVNNNPSVNEIIMWTNDYAWKNNNFAMDENLRFRHTYIIWQTWVGKSTLMENAVLQDIYNWKWVFLIDPHWDLIENIMKHFPDPRNPKYKDRYKDLIYIDFWDKERSVWLNLLESINDYEQSKVVNSFVDMLKKIFPDSWESMWPTFFEYIIYCIKTIKFMEKLYKPTLWDIIRVINNEEYRRYCLAQIKDRSKYLDVFEFWENHEKRTWDWSSSQNKDEILPYIRTKLTKFLENPYIVNVVWQPDSTIDFFDAMNSNKIILVKMEKWEVLQENMQFLWLIVISKLLKDIFRRSQIKNENERVPFFIYVDEFQNFVTEEFQQILSEARKYRTWLTIAHQYINQLINQKNKDESVLKAVFGNAWTFISFRIWPDDAPKLEEKYWNKSLLPKESFLNIDKYNAYVSTQWWSSTLNSIPPFHIKTIPTSKPKILQRDQNWKIIWDWILDDNLINQIIAYSKDKYTRWKDVIEKHREKYCQWFSI